MIDEDNWFKMLLEAILFLWFALMSLFTTQLNQWSFGYAKKYCDHATEKETIYSGKTLWHCLVKMDEKVLKKSLVNEASILIG